MATPVEMGWVRKEGFITDVEGSDVSVHAPGADLEQQNSRHPLVECKKVRAGQADLMPADSDRSDTVLEVSHRLDRIK
eukprot:49431-Rhodomonas_salina.4